MESKSKWKFESKLELKVGIKIWNQKLELKVGIEVRIEV